VPSLLTALPASEIHLLFCAGVSDGEWIISNNNSTFVSVLFTFCPHLPELLLVWKCTSLSINRSISVEVLIQANKDKIILSYVLYCFQIYPIAQKSDQEIICLLTSHEASQITWCE
jgi:hypothetical protein